MKLTTERETLIRTYIKDQALLAVPSLSDHILITPMYFASAQDFCKSVGDGVYNEKTYKVSYLMFNFGQFTDAKGKGCDDDPVTFLTYKLQLFEETQEARNSRPNSHDSLVEKMIALRNRFLISKDIITNEIVHQGLAQQGDMITLQDSEYVVGVLGDWFNFRITVEINK